MDLDFAAPDAPSRPLHVLDPNGLAVWLPGQSDRIRTWLTATAFRAGPGELTLLPGEDGACIGAVFGLGRPEAQARTRFQIAQAAQALPAGNWHLNGALDADQMAEAALAWLLGSYAFTRYQSNGPAPERARLVALPGIDGDRIRRIAGGEILTRDLINTPAADMGPAQLAQAAVSLAEAYGARIQITKDEALIDANLPLIHTVGRASPRRPRLIDMRWGGAGPRLTLVGKGVCFDTGGLNLKPGSSMGLMKKDMGGAAAVLGLAQMIMASDLPLRLRVLIPAVENALGGAAFRPQDILTSRRGFTVEINNTDAEGRLVLADALSLGDEERPDLMVSMATLTGAARVAVGPDLAPFFSDAPGLPAILSEAGAKVRDPVWQLPFHAPYEALIEPGIADLDNAPKGGSAGAIAAALFLRRFVENAHAYVHFDIFGWQPTAAPARPKGGVGQGTRALFEALPRLLDLPS